MKYYGKALMAIAIAALLLAGCGDDGDNNGAQTGGQAAGVATDIGSPAADPECDPEAASIIPDPSGRPQHVYFFDDT